MSDSQTLRIVVDSKPDDRELAAITAAVMAMTPSQPEPTARPADNPWREAFKRESLRKPLEENT